MATVIRPYDGNDRDAVTALSLRAWAPVFASLEAILGPSGLFAWMHPDWREDQRRAVHSALADADLDIHVAEVDGEVTGFVAVRIDQDSRLGEIHMIAVDPDHQRQGIGARLTDAAATRMKTLGMEAAMIDTGGDPGHAPARRTYERAGFTPLPITRYFKRL
ncbi:MAG: GNAT family N-acetyltransferase [Nocardiopsaceae bacterium]|nr:GNAT family N-acetyltransferase [Nocardiopsaceae bacterium]